MKYNRLKYTYTTNRPDFQRRRNLHALTGMSKKSDGHIRLIRNQNGKNNLKALKAWVGEDSHYVCPACHEPRSIVGKVSAEVAVLQGLVDAICTAFNPAFTSTVLSQYSETLILAVGIAATQRLLDDEHLPADADYVRDVLAEALEMK